MLVEESKTIEISKSLAWQNASVSANDARSNLANGNPRPYKLLVRISRDIAGGVVSINSILTIRLLTVSAT
ncbi:MAG: hypothetical protein DDT31_01592 [Syntrophomonadaceae bacterium]|nr:hypothetical protein [Bacillota bacterium]